MVHAASVRPYVVFIIFGARQWIWLEYGIRNQINVDSIFGHFWRALDIVTS